jgi:hypothetical protein
MSNIALRNTLISIILAVALVLVILLRDKSPYGKNQSSFASLPKKEITGIEFTDGEKKLMLSKEGEGWLVNGTNEARKSAVLFIIRVLTEMTIKSPVSPEMLNTEITEKGISPVNVSVFENGRLINSFLVYKTGSNPYGNMMKMRERSKPFIVYVPGYEADIGSAFITSELFWRPFTIFNLLPSEISSITLESYSDPASSFSIICKDGTFTFSDTEKYLAGWDSSRIKRYVSYFTWVPFESWAFDIPDYQKERIKSQNPLYRISVKKTSGNEVNLTMWERSDTDTGVRDSDRLLGKTDAVDEFFIIRYFDIDPLLKKRSYFYNTPLNPPRGTYR